MKHSFHRGTVLRGDDKHAASAYFVRCKCGNQDHIATNTMTSSVPNERLLKKFRARGWTITKQHEYCPECSRKGVPFHQQETDMNVKDTQKVVGIIDRVAEPRTMQPEDRRRIFRSIDERWDEPARRYSGLTTDKSLAEDLHCPQAWVKEVREQSFGSFGTNEELDAVRQQLAGLENEIKAKTTLAIDVATSLEALEHQVVALRKRIEKVTGV